MSKQSKIRHKILTELFKSAEKETNPQTPKISLTNIDISKLTGISIDKIDILHELLHEEGEINCTFMDNSIHQMLITSKGRQSYINERYLKEGRKEFWDAIYDPLKIILPIISILLAIFALSLNYLSTNKIDKLNNEIKTLNNELIILKKKASR